MKFKHCFHVKAALAFMLAVSLSGAAIAEENGIEPPAQKVIFANGQDGLRGVRIPALAVTLKGTLLAFCESRAAGDFGGVDLVLKRSLDRGKTWGSVQVIHHDGRNTIGNPCPVVDRHTDTIWMLFNRTDASEHYTNTQATEKSIWQTGKPKREVWAIKSTDDGATWSKPINVSDSTRPPNTAWQSVGPGCGIQLSSGRLVVPCCRTIVGVDFNDRSIQDLWRAYSIYSDDHGGTWHYGEDARPDADETQMVELVDGRLMLVARRPWCQPLQRLRVANSSDQGKTWSKVQSHADLPTWGCQLSIARYTTADRYEKNRLLISSPTSASDRSKMTIFLSYDEGKTWPVSKVLNPGYGGYSCLAVLPDMSLCCLYETDGCSTVTFAHFSLEWLTDGTDKLQPRTK